VCRCGHRQRRGSGLCTHSWPERQGRHKQTRAFSSFTSQLEAMADWFASEGVTEVVMKLRAVLEVALVRARERGFDLNWSTLATSRSSRRKSDVADAEWLAELLEHGLLRSSFVPRRRSGSYGTC